MVEFVRAYPPAFPMIGDLLTKEMDWPGARLVSERLKKMLPPALQDQQPGDGGAEQAAAAAQQELEQAKQALGALQQELAQTKQALEADTVKAQAQAALNRPRRRRSSRSNNSRRSCRSSCKR